MKLLKPALLGAFLLLSGVFVASYAAPEGTGHVGEPPPTRRQKATGIAIQRDTRPNVRDPGKCLGSRKPAFE
jgi:hypothetical protein